MRFFQRGYRLAAAMAVFAILASSAMRLSAQGSTVWQFENVSQGDPITGCVSGMTLAGFDYGPDGRPVIAWREENGCGGPLRVFWTRQEQGQWHPREFLSERSFAGGAAGDYAHQLALRPGDGNPFLVYADVGSSNSINTYVADLGANPAGGVSTYLEGLVGAQQCASVNYSTAFSPSDQTPQWATGLSLCSGGGPVRLNGITINPAVYGPKASLAVSADGTRHVLWNSSSDVYYSRFPPNASSPDLTTHLFDDLNRFGGEVRIVVDGEGTLHAIVRGPDISADWDLGAMVYLKSIDGGNTWSSREYVDPHDDPAIQNPWNGNSDVSLVVDAAGVPAVSFWRWTSELWYARRDGPGGTWTQARIVALPIANPVRSNQLRLDPDGTPVIAYYDPVIHKLRLARPVPAGTVLPSDVAVTVTASPTVVPPGASTTFTVTATNKGTTNLDRVVLANRLPEGASFISASPSPDADGLWTYALTSGASATITINATAPFAEGAAADVATVATDAADSHPEDNASAAGIRVAADQCFVLHGANSDLRGWWRGDDSAANAIGTPAEGINVYGGVSYEPAVIGSGFKFDGTGAVHVYHDNDNFYYPNDGSFTVEAFVKTLSPGGRIATRYECRPGACGPTAWFLSLDGSGHLQGYLRNGNGDLTLPGGRVINDGVFHHVALVIDRATSQAMLYVDGTVDAVAPYTIGAIADSNGPYTPLVIGARFEYSGNNVEFFNGVIDELAVHGRALGAAELAQVASAILQPACGNFTPTNGIDVAVVVEPSPASVAPGGIASFMIGVRNIGSVDLSGVNVNNQLSNNATFVDAAPSPQSAGGGFQNFNIGSLAKGEQKWIVVRAMAPFVPGVMSSQAHHLVDADQNGLNDESSAVVRVVADACFVPPASLVGRWRADGDVADATGGAIGSMAGNAGFEVGRSGQAFSIHGNGSYVAVPDTAKLRPAQFTIGAWVKPSMFRQGSYDTVIAKGASGLDPYVGADRDSYWLGFNSGYPVLFTYHHDGQSYATQASSPLQPMQWYHLAATFDGNTARVYVNGVEVARQIIGSPIRHDSSGVPLLFGDDWQYGYANGADFYGLIDDVTIHDRALSAGEITAMFDGSNTACIVVRRTSTTTTIGSATNPSASGEPVTYTATVAAVGNTTTPNGAVSFVYVPTNTTLATIALVGGAAVYQTSALPEGAFNIQAIFTGNASFTGSSATLAQVIDPAASTAIRNGVPESRPLFNGVGMILPTATHNGCTATLISPFVVLTAAQCLKDDDPNAVFEFSLGAGRIVRLTDIRVHPSYATLDGINLAYDVALATIDRTVAAGWTDIVPATLRAEPLSPVVEAVAVGFGDTSAGGQRTSGTLLVTGYLAGEDVNFNMLPDGYLEANPEAANQMFCRPGTGGPLFFDDQIAGIASFRNVATCAEPGPGFYVTFNHLADWIHTTTIDLEDGSDSTPAATTTTLTSSGNPSASGQAITFTAIVAAVGAAPTPIGEVAFVYSPTNTTLATIALAGGIASFQTSALPEGTFNIQAIFAGNASFTGSSATLTQVVEPAASTPIRNGIPESRPLFNGVGMILPTATHNGCTATLISPFIVLTAAQCLRDDAPNAVFEFSLGAGRIARLTDIRVHPFYETADGVNLVYDVALATIDRTVAAAWTDVIPATLRAEPMSPVVEGTAVGFGASSDGGRRTSGTLLVTGYLAGEDPNFNSVPDVFIETNPGAAKQMFCQPGTGGPLFYEDQIAGVASFRNVATCAESGPGFYVSLPHLADWIQAAKTELTDLHPLTVQIDVVERITVTDSLIVTPAVMINVAEAIHVVDLVVPTPAVMISVAEAVHVTDSVNPSPAVMLNVSEQVHVVDGIASAVINTPAGTNVMAPASGPPNAPASVSVTFPAVTQAGNTTFATHTGVLAPPDGFRYGTPPVTFDISTTAVYTAPLRVCITFAATAFTKPAAVRLFHYENGRWVDRTVSLNTITRVVCASVNSLSPFAIAEPEDLEGRMDGDGEVDAGGKEYRLGFHIAERHIGVERGRLELTVVTPKNGKKKATRDEFASTAISAISFWDDPAFAPGRFNRPRPQADSAVFTGVGKWNGASGYTFEARASDEGESGRGRDRFTVTIRGANGAVVASVDGLLVNGNIQSERLKKEHWR